MSGFASLTFCLAILCLFLPAVAVAASTGKADSPFAQWNDDDCWRKLPQVEKGGGQPLPSWARALAGSMPRTTAALLRLDYVHRTSSPIDPKLRARMRWVAAHANRCAYAEAYAVFDAGRAGLSDGELEALRRGDDTGLSASEKHALEFALKMTVNSAGVTDAGLIDGHRNLLELKRAHLNSPVSCPGNRSTVASAADVENPQRTLTPGWRGRLYHIRSYKAQGQSDFSFDGRIRHAAVVRETRCASWDTFSNHHHSLREMA